MNILLVEDDVSVAHEMRVSMEDWDHTVETVCTGQDALRRVRQKNFDLVFLDISLPDCKGHELIPQLKGIWQDLMFITMTDYNTRELEWEVREKGILYYMIKPFEAYEMKENKTTGRPTYSAPSGMHDDTVMGRALMLRAATSPGRVFV